MSRPAESVTRSLWLDQALGSEEISDSVQAASGKTDADIVIVGGGFTGLWTALRLKEQEPALRVALLEADICGGGASGRNGGFVMSWWAKFLALEALCGTEEALWLARESEDAIREIGDFCGKHAPYAVFRQDGWLWTATSDKQLGAWEGTTERLDALRANPYVPLTREQVAERAGSLRHVGGVLEPAVATVHPGFLVRALRRRALALGVRIHEYSPVTAVTGKYRVTVNTSDAQITADKAVLATNAWSIREPEIRQAIVVASSDVVASAAVPDWLSRVGRNDGLAISDSRAMVHYYRTTSDGHLIFGKGGGSGLLAFGSRVGKRFDGHSSIPEKVERWMRWTYPDLPAGPLAADWTGPIDKSKSGLPLFGALSDRPNVLYAVGFSGDGVGPCALAGRIVASLALGREDRWARCGLVRPPERDFPPEPFRYVGGKFVRRAVARLDDENDRGRDGSWLTRKAASLAPVALSPTKLSE